MDVEAYLRRIEYAGPRDPSPSTLRNLHRQHLFTVPFENLDIALGVPIVLEPEALFNKIVIRKRGGFCYELNGLFHELLTALGFRAEMLSARVRNEDGSFGREFDHMLLKVSMEEPWIADVGFGDSFVEPLLLVRPGSQGTGRDSQYSLRLFDGRWGLSRCDREKLPVPLYHFAELPRQIIDFAAMCVFHQTSPESHFTQSYVCTKPMPDGRITLSKMRLVTTRNGVREETQLASEHDLRECLSSQFGIEFPSGCVLSQLCT